MDIFIKDKYTYEPSIRVNGKKTYIVTINAKGNHVIMINMTENPVNNLTFNNAVESNGGTTKTYRTIKEFRVDHAELLEDIISKFGR